MRSLSREARHERRVQVIRLRAAGYIFEAIAAQTGLSWTGVFDVCRCHAEDGAKALHDAIGGRQFGEGRRLSAEQEREIRRLICDKTPDQLKMPYALWTRGAVAELIEQRFGIRLSVRTMALSLALGLHAAKADPPCLRAVAGGGEEVAGRGLPGHCRGRQGRRGRDSRGGRDRLAQQ